MKELSERGAQNLLNAVRAYDQGNKAYFRGADHTENPYDKVKQEKEFDAWLFGWKDAHDGGTVEH